MLLLRSIVLSKFCENIYTISILSLTRMGQRKLEMHCRCKNICIGFCLLQSHFAVLFTPALLNEERNLHNVVVYQNNIRLTSVDQNNIPLMRNDGKPNTIQYLVPFSQSHSANFALVLIMKVTQPQHTKTRAHVQ